MESTTARKALAHAIRITGTDPASRLCPTWAQLKDISHEAYQEVYLPLYEAWDTYGGMENWTEVRKQALFDHKVKTKCSNRSKQGAKSIKHEVLVIAGTGHELSPQVDLVGATVSPRQLETSAAMLEASEELILATSKKRSRKPSDKIVAALESDDSLTHKLQNKPASKRKHVVMLPRPPLKQLHPTAEAGEM